MTVWKPPQVWHVFFSSTDNNQFFFGAVVFFNLILIFRSTSTINSIAYVPFMSVDLKERFAFPVPFSWVNSLLFYVFFFESSVFKLTNRLSLYTNLLTINFFYFFYFPPINTCVTEGKMFLHLSFRNAKIYPILPAISCKTTGDKDFPTYCN